MKQFLNYIILIILVTRLSGAETPVKDFTYEHAQIYAFNGDYDSALVICDYILASYPNDMDILVFKARILGWQGFYDLSRGILQQCYEIDSVNYDMLDAASDVEYWSEEYVTALEYVDYALAVYPGDSLFISKKEMLEALLNPPSDSTKILGNKCMYAQFYYDMFNEFYKRRWQVFTLGLNYTINNNWILIPEINYGHLSPGSGMNGDRDAIQADMDAFYVSPGMYYLYANYGYSPSKLFPNHKAGLEYFSKFIYHTEVSFGFRYMKWEDHLFFLTGSLSKYYLNYWFTFRPYLLLKDNNVRGSYLLAGRYYMNTTEYAGLGFVFGAAPDQSLDMLMWDISYRSFKTIISLNKSLKGPFSLFTSVSYSYEEYFLGEYQHRFDLLATLYYCF